MAHFAQLDENNKVIQVVVVDNSQEHRGQEYLAIDCNLGGTWVQTSYNGNFGKQFAGIGYTYDTERKVFIPVKPYNSWIFNEETWMWDAPVPYPVNSGAWEWDEETLSWVNTFSPPTN